MPESTDRLELPLLSPGQAQKELTHNEALTLLSMNVQPVVEAVAPVAVPASPYPGQCWIVGTAPSGAWAGRAGALACWTQGGWRFAAGFEGMSVWSIADGVMATRLSGSWQVGPVHATSLRVGGNQIVGQRQSAIATPAGGPVIDAEARVAIGAVLAALRTHGLIAT